MATGDKLVTLDGLKAVYQDLNGKTTDLKSALDQKKWNINNSENWEVGYYGRSTGEYQYYPSNLASCCMINKIPDDVFLVTCSNTFKMRIIL